MFDDQTVLDAKRIGVFSCKIGTPIGEAAKCMVQEDVSAVVVVDEEGCLAGIITRTDLLRALLASDDWEAHTIDEFMIVDVVTVEPQTRLVAGRRAAAAETHPSRRRRAGRRRQEQPGLCRLRRRPGLSHGQRYVTRL